MHIKFPSGAGGTDCFLLRSRLHQGSVQIYTLHTLALLCRKWKTLGSVWRVASAADAGAGATVGGAGHLSPQRWPLSDGRVRGRLPPEVVSVLPGRAEWWSDGCAANTPSALRTSWGWISRQSNGDVCYSYALSRFRMACTSVSSPLSGSDLGAG